MTQTLSRDIHHVSDAELWAFRAAATDRLLTFARGRLAGQLAVAGAPPDALERAAHVLDPGVLTLGFARRFATYKRPNLLLHDPERLVRLLTHAERPVQLILAGKAHPADAEGQTLIQQWSRFIRRPEVRDHVVFLADYDMHVAEEMVQGVDVWVNTPRRPWEACGTSGMKVLVNGGLNLSQLDGWWAEAYTHEVGWAVGDRDGHGHDPAQEAADDAREADQLYGLLEHEVVPQFYARDAQGLPAAWVKRMRESMAQLTPQFSADRAVREYTLQHYLPAADAFTARAADRGAEACRIVASRQRVNAHWHDLRFDDVSALKRDAQHHWEVRVELGGLEPQDVCVQMYAEANDHHDGFSLDMQPDPGADGTTETACVYTAWTPDIRPLDDYTARVMPRIDGVPRPLEDPRIRWQR